MSFRWNGHEHSLVLLQRCSPSGTFIQAQNYLEHSLPLHKSLPKRIRHPNVPLKIADVNLRSHRFVKHRSNGNRPLPVRQRQAASRINAVFIINPKIINLRVKPEVKLLCERDVIEIGAEGQEVICSGNLFFNAPSEDAVYAQGYIFFEFVSGQYFKRRIETPCLDNILAGSVFNHAGTLEINSGCVGAQVELELFLPDQLVAPDEDERPRLVVQHGVPKLRVETEPPIPADVEAGLQGRFSQREGWHKRKAVAVGVDGAAKVQFSFRAVRLL